MKAFFGALRTDLTSASLSKMSSVVLDAEYVDSGEDESEESAVELWSPSASDSDRASVYLSNLPSPQTLDSLCRRGRKELTSGERQMKWALNCFTGR